jgi:anti-sigma regulatory factor (Ser/Thr protein kinase)
MRRDFLSDPSSFWQRHRVRSFRDFRGELGQFFARRGVPAKMSNALILATQEACNNACQHGADEACCDVSVSYLDGTITIEVADRGCGFHFEAVKATWPPTLLEGSGRGLFLASELTDQLEVVRRRQGTLVRLFKTVE